MLADGRLGSGRQDAKADEHADTDTDADADAHRDPDADCDAEERPRSRSRRAPMPRPVAPPALLFELWPEHLPPYRLFCALDTQWAWDQGQRTGLPAERVRATPAFRQLPRAERENVFADMVYIERAYLRRLAARALAERQREQARLRRRGGGD